MDSAPGLLLFHHFLTTAAARVEVSALAGCGSPSNCYLAAALRLRTAVDFSFFKGVQTIRFYERRGLLPEPQRKDSGYRIYGEQDLRRLRFIRQAKALRFALEEIGKLLRMRERGLSPCCEVISIGERHLKEVEQQIAELERFRDELTRAIKQWKRSGKPQLPAGSICILIERVMDTNRQKKGEKSWLSKKGKSSVVRSRSAAAR